MGDRCDEDMWKSAKAASQTNVSKNPLTIPYLLYAYGVPRSSFKRRVAADRKGQTMDGYDGRSKGRPFISVIGSRTAAFGLYSPWYFYVYEHILYESSDENGLKHSENISMQRREREKTYRDGNDWQGNMTLATRTLSRNLLMLWKSKCADRIGNYHSASMDGAPLEPSRGG